MDQLLLGIDIGTTGTKAALFTENGSMLAIGQEEYGISFPRNNQAEQDPEDWWRAVCGTTRKVLKEIPGAAGRIAGVAVSSQAPILLPIDSEGEPLRPAMIWMDRRAEIEAAELGRKMGEGVIESVTGNHPDPFYVAAKLLWMRSHEPGIFSQTSIFLQANGYINYKLTGQYSLDSSHASLLQLRDYRKNEWSEVLCELCGVDPGWFPPVMEASEICGEVTSEASRLTGIPVGTPVVAGTVDSAAAALEAGITAQGTVAEMTGTSTVMIIPNEAGIIEPSFIAMPHAVPGIHLLLAALVSSGASLKWFRDELEPGNSFEDLTCRAQGSDPGSNGLLFLPYLMGERSPVWDSDARGVFFGLSKKVSTNLQ
jgi:xylulokinase